MDSIVIRCKMCKHAMKVSAAKAGKRVKCKKCDAVVLVKAEEEKKPEPKPEAVAAGAPPGAAAPAPAAPAPAAEDDDGPATYIVTVDPELEQRQKELMAEELAAQKKKGKTKLPKVGRKMKAIPDADSWTSVQRGMFFIFLGCIAWIIGHMLQGSYVILGSTEFSEYATLVSDILSKREDPELPGPGKSWNVDELQIHLGIVAGKAYIGYANLCLTLSSLLYFVQSFLFALGFFFYLAVPRRYGMFGQVLSMIALLLFNMLFAFIFRLLPVLGAHGYILIPYLVPEIALTEYNIERVVPIHVMLAGGGWGAFWENLLNFVLRATQYFEPMFGCIFLWSAGITIKDENMAARGRGLTEMILGVLFTYLCFQLLSLCGASPMLVTVLRIIYGFWFVIMAAFILSYAGMLMSCRAILEEKIHPKNELETEKKDDDDEDEDDDDDDEDDDD